MLTLTNSYNTESTEGYRGGVNLLSNIELDGSPKKSSATNYRT